MKNSISTFYVLDTQEALDASSHVFKIQLEYIIDTLKENSRVKPVLDKNPCFNTILDKNIDDNPRIRFWLTCTKEFIKSLNSDIDPSPSSISCLFVDSLDPDRVIELHLFELLGIWIDFMINKNEPFRFSLKIKMPENLKLGSLGKINLSDHSKEILVWNISFNGNDTLEFSTSDTDTIKVETQLKHSLNPENFRDFSIVTDHSKGVFEIPVHDNALCEPYYANGAIIRSKSACERWCQEVLIPAMNILDEIDEGIVSESLSLVTIILPLHSGSIGFGSASSEDILGLIYLPGVDTKYDIAECFLHEALHQKLFRIESAVNLFEDHSPMEEEYYSPWRIDPRPLRMLLHGSFVFTAVAEMWAMFANNPDYDHSNGDPAFLTLLRAQQSIKAIDIIRKYGNLNQLGENLSNSIYDNAFSAIERVSPSKGVSQDVVTQLKDHNEKYITYLQ